jgi:hypothetical protein
MVWIRMMRLMCAAPNDRYGEAYLDRVLEQFQLGISTVEDQNCQAILQQLCQLYVLQP